MTKKFCDICHKEKTSFIGGGMVENAIQLKGDLLFTYQISFGTVVGDICEDCCKKHIINSLKGE